MKPLSELESTYTISEQKLAIFVGILFAKEEKKNFFAFVLLRCVDDLDSDTHTHLEARGEKGH